mgnify:CR=1 FL=1
MYSYVNKVSVGANKSKNEVVLSFVQEAPTLDAPELDENGNIAVSSIERAKVADIVVTTEFAKEISRIILSVVDG